VSCVVMSLGDCVMCCPGVARPVCHVLSWCCQACLSCVAMVLPGHCVMLSCVVMLFQGLCVM